jgi:hypothetical protein
MLDKMSESNYTTAANGRKAVINKLPYRSYEIKLEDGTTRRRTSRHVRFSAKPHVNFDYDDNVAGLPSAELPTITVPESATKRPPVKRVPSQMAPAANDVPPDPPTLTRSGRLVIKPARYR